MQIFHYDPTTGEFLSAGQARQDPRDPDNWLVPAHATIAPPPATGAGEVAVFDDTTWAVEEDHRGKTVYASATGEPITVKAIGPLPEGYAEQPPLPSLSEVKALRKKDVDARLARSFREGMSYAGKVLQLDLDSQNRISQSYQIARSAQAGILPWNPDFKWRMADNSYLPLPDASDMIALGLAAQAEVHRRINVSWGHKDAIDGLGVVEEARSYDIEVGW